MLFIYWFAVLVVGDAVDCCCSGGSSSLGQLNFFDAIRSYGAFLMDAMIMIEMNSDLSQHLSGTIKSFVTCWKVENALSSN